LAYAANHLKFQGQWSNLSRRAAEAKTSQPGTATATSSAQDIEMLSRLAGRTAKQLQGRWRRLEELDFVNTGKRPLERKRKKVKGAVKRTR